MTKFKPLACGYHSHLDYSLDGGSTASGKIMNAAAQGRIADCVTDHGVMSGIVVHWEAAKKLYKSGKIKNKIQSIHGIEAYVIDEDRPAKVFKNGKTEPAYYHMTIHFKTQKAYEYFCSLTPAMEKRAIVRYGEKKPLLKFEELYPIAGQITLGSGCLMGMVQKNVLVGRSDIAVKNYHLLRELAGPGNFFVEVFPHIIDKEWKRPTISEKREIITPGYFDPITTVRRDPGAIDPEPCSANGIIDIQKDPNAFVINLAHQHKDPIIISLDDHYDCDESKIVQDVRLGNGTESWKFYGSYASNNSDYCANILQKQLGASDRDIEEWIDNSYKFVDLFKDYRLVTSDDRWLLPTAEMVYNVKTDTTTILYELIKKYGRMPKEDSVEYNTYKQRLDYEVSVLRDNGVADFLPYFYVIEDAADYAKKVGILWNTRGSAGGSLVLYLIGVSITDPIKYGLPFERFLTLGRIKSGSLPDIDSDWQQRDPIIKYLADKYGELFSLISTDLMMRLKSSILDVERSYLGYVTDSTREMCKHIKGAPPGQSDSDWLFGGVDKTTGERLKGFMEDAKDPNAENLRNYAKMYPDIWSAVQKCIGITKTRGVHAGGAIISPEPIHNVMPLVYTEKGAASAYNMKGAETVGAVKYDFLGVATLHSMSISMASIKEREGIALEWGEFPDDPSVYSDIIDKGLLSGIFQLNTKTVSPFVNKIKPKSIIDISVLTALVRPGSMDAPSPDPKDPASKTAAEYFVDCAQGKRSPYFIHEDLVPILKDTYGIIIFQEQALEIFRLIAGYSYEKAEEVRRAIGKKIKDLLELHGNVLKDKCKERGWTDQQASTLFNSIIASSNYSFNKSHAVSYAIVAYNGCWLKKHHPLHFWKGELTINNDDHDKIKEHLPECRKYLLPVDITKSSAKDWVIEGDKIRPPLSLLKGCGESGAEAIKNFIELPLESINQAVGEVVDA